ncbi:GTPase-activating protein CdGAPr [Armadillidium vulgare]|nr:GTPase-activating protein CdGAPr [Armadillidium vulgare]
MAFYRLSGITSNIQKLRNAFDEERVPDLYGDESILQDIHCVSSVLKMYFRELPNPLLTYQLYDKFVSAVMQNEDVRLLHVRDVVQQLPPPHYRTLEYLIQHLARVASHSSNTGMTPRNIAIVWAPNLLRSKDLEKGGVAALQDVGTQAVVTEYLVRYVDLIFNDKIPIFSPSTNGTEGSPKKLRPKSLAISTPTKLLSIDEARNRALAAIKSDQKYIEVGGGPDSLPKTYHTVIDLPSRKGGSLKQKKSPLGWKTLFSKNKHQRKASTPNDISLNISDSIVTESDLNCHITKRLRPVKSVESLVSTPASLNSNRNSQVVENASSENDRSPLVAPRERKGSISSECSSVPSPRTHNRSVSHDSYFNLLEKKEDISTSTSTAVKEERESDGEMSPESSKIFLDISELNLEFNTSEAEMKIFSEDDTLKSTSIEDTLSRSTDDVGENISLGSDLTKSKENVNRCEKRSLKDKLKKRFTSPSSQRKETNFSDSSEDSRTNSLKRASSVIKEKLVQALSPETMRKRELSVVQTSPGGSPNAKLKKSEKIKEPSCINEVNAENSPVQKLESLSTQNSLEDKVIGDEIKERLSIESALIDPELLDKITRMRVSPSVSASEASSVSLAEATVSDNESFTLGSSNNTGSNEVEGGVKDVYVSDSGTLPQSLITTPCTPPVTIIPDPHFEDEISKREIPHVKHSEKSSLSKGESASKPVKPVKDRPNSLLGISLTDSSCIGSSLTSPETPQGDSTFLDIQYHPLSDTTEPSTPSDSHFMGNIDEVAKETPRQSSPLSPDLSSSSTDEPPNENCPFYENIELTTSVSPSNFTNLEIFSGKNLQEYNSKFSSEISTPTAQESELEYENIEYNVLEQSIYEDDDTKTFDSNSVTPCYENLQKSFSSEYEVVNQDRSADTTYENVTPTEHKNKNENLDENYYEDYVFNQCSEYENIKFSNANTQSTKTEAEIEGEEVYQQVKFLRKSIQEVNKILNENSENALTQVQPLQPINIITCQTSVEERRRDERVDGEANVDSECLDSPVTPSSSSLVTEVLVLPSFSSPTESTTEDAASSSEESESQSSPKGTHVQHPISPQGESSTNSSSISLNSFIPTLSPPSPDLTGVIPLTAASLVSSKNTLSPTNPSPWPRSNSKQGHVWPPVPKPRNLPAFIIGPVLSPTSTLSSPLDSPKFHINISDEPTPEEIIEKPKTYTSHPKNIVHIVSMSCSKSEASPKKFDDAQVVTNSTKIENKIESDKVKTLSDNDLFTNIDTGPDIKEEDEAQKRERIEKYKEERRSFLREKYKSESFKGEKDDMLLRLKQKATSPSRQEEEEEEKLLDNKKGSGHSHSFKIGQIFQNSKPNDNSVSDHILVTCQRSNVPVVETFHIQSLPKSDNDCLFQRSISEDSRILVNKNKSESQQNVSSKSDSKCNIQNSDSIHQNKHDTKSKLDDDINVKERVAIWSRQDVTQKGDCKTAGSVSVKTTPPKSRKFQNSSTEFSCRKISVPTKCYTLPQTSEKENASEGKIGGTLTFKTTKVDQHMQHPSTSPVQKIEKNPFSISKSENISVIDKKLQTSQEEPRKRPILLSQKSESDLREPITLKTRSYSVGAGLGSATQSSSVSSNFRVGCQQQRRIKDMKALFEKDGNSQDVKKTVAIRQTSREGISN